MFVIRFDIQKVDNKLAELLNKHFVQILKIRNEKELEIQKLAMSEKAKYLQRYKEVMC